MALSCWFSWVESTPSAAGGTVYVGASDCRRVTAIDAPKGKAIWDADAGGLTWGTPLVIGDTLFAGSASQSDAMLPHTGGLVATDRFTARVGWRNPIAPEEGLNRSGFIRSARAFSKIVIARSAALRRDEAIHLNSSWIATARTAGLAITVHSVNTRSPRPAIW